MLIEHKFFRVKHGIASFAVVGVSSHPSAAHTISWSESASGLRSAYGSAVEKGVRIAATEHERRNGPPHAVEIISIADAPADTKPDAVTCAAALAAWKSWGHAEAEAVVVFEDGEWRVTFTDLGSSTQRD